MIYDLKIASERFDRSALPTADKRRRKTLVLLLLFGQVF